MAFNRIASLIDPKKVATLKGERTANKRLIKVIYWMERVLAEGGDLDAYLEEALQPYNDNPKWRALVKASLLHNHKIAKGRYGCFDAPDAAEMANGKPPVVQKGRYRGEQLHVDHVIAIKQANEVSKDFANFLLEPASVNRSKSGKHDRVTHFTAQRLAAAGRLSPARMTALNIKMRPALSSPQRGATSPISRSGRTAPVTSMTAPALIIARVDGLLEELEHWEQLASAVVLDARDCASQTTENIERSTIVRDQSLAQLAEDDRTFRNLKSEGKKSRERVESSAASARQASKEAASVASEAAANLRHWEAELSSAEAWLQRALAREQAAESEVQRCEWNVSSAESSLDSARAALSDAQNRTEYAGKDSQGNDTYRSVDTSSYERAVSDARAHLDSCLRDLRDAEFELSAARDDRRAAEARVAACTRAVGLSQEAVASASMASESSESALGAAARAGEEQTRLENTINLADGSLRKELAATVAMKRELRAAQTHEAAAIESLRRAERANSSACQRSAAGRHETRDRLNQLRVFDSPINF